MKMKTSAFIKEQAASPYAAKWALSISNDMAEVWDALIAQGNWEWLVWTSTRPGVFPDSVLRKLACRFVREIPLPDGRKVWDLLTDERSRKAVEVAEAFADGNATEEELQVACAAASEVANRDRSNIVWPFFADADYALSYASSAARAPSMTAADRAAQIRMIAELGNPFK